MAKLNWNPLEKRVYHYKKKAIEFFCPLCSTKRCLTVHFRLAKIHYIQIALLSSITIALLYPFMEGRSFWFIFVYWASFEFVQRWRFKNQLPCPHCGFDAALYKRDVKKTREVVQQFWNNRDNSNDLGDELPH